MKYASYFIFIAFIAGTIFLLKNALEPRETPLLVVGSARCAECHELLKYGNQQKVWNESAHKKAYNSLLSDKAKEFAKKNNIDLPVNNKICLKCHTTRYFLGVEISESYYIEEGVGCEACHGAGSRYLPAEIMKVEKLFIKNNGIICDERICIKCHSPAANKTMTVTETICPFQTHDFVYKSEFEKIKHPLTKDNFK
jgi:hypothetical protein